MTEEEIILAHILQCPPIDLALKRSVLTISQQEQYERFLRRRASGEPLQYILGTCNFMGLELSVNPSVLIPRPETEQLVDAALKAISKMSFSIGYPIHILDLGTGSGNIAIALAKFVPLSKIESVDISPMALELAIINAKQNKVLDQIKFIYDDYLVPLRSKPKDLYDLIISNPPYIPTSQLSSLPRDVQQEPALALDGGEDGLNFYRIIIEYTPGLLRAGACLMMEFGDACLPAGRDSCPQSDEIRAMIEETKAFSKIEIIKDLAGRDRIISAKKL